MSEYTAPADLTDVEPEESAGVEVIASKKAPPRTRSWAKLTRDLSEKDATNPAVNKLLIDEIERLENEVSELKSHQVNFHAADKRAAIFEEKLQKNNTIEMIHAGCMAVGGILLGGVSSPDYHWSVGVCGAVLIFGGIVAKRIKL
jgi:hypothetical protein